MFQPLEMLGPKGVQAEIKKNSVLLTFRLQSQGHVFVKYIVIGWPENWVKLMNIFKGAHFTVQSIRATS